MFLRMHQIVILSVASLASLAAGNNGSPASDFVCHICLLTILGKHQFTDISWKDYVFGIQLGVVFISVRKLGVRLLHSAVHGL